MARRTTAVRVFVCLLVFAVAGSLAASDRHIVLFKGTGTPADFGSQVGAAGGVVESQHEVLAVVSGLSDESAAALNGVADVFADADVSLNVEVAESDVSADTPASPSNPAGAFFYPRQWHLWAIGANTAWAAGRLGSPDVTVAVLDTGIDRQTSPHADLAGLVDYARGARFQLDQAGCIPAGFTFSPTDDLMFHGTHVASTISSNASAAAGVTSKVRLVPVKVLGLVRQTGNPAGPNCTGGSGSLSAVLNGVLHAADIDADVANMSLGGGFYKMGNGRYVGLINSVFNYAFRKGTLVVVAAGNEALDMDHDGPLLKTYCAAPNVVCVSATGPSKATLSLVFENLDSFAGYSNYGRSGISVAAPGGTGSGSTAAQRQRGYVTAACSRSTVSLGLTVCQTGTFVVGSNGTSMAAPHVSGLAALIVENVGKDKPAQVKAILEQSADDLWQPGTDPYYGKGRINVPRALGLQ
jgi:lantibiotic leader peptide-processing serine protease